MANNRLSDFEFQNLTVCKVLRDESANPCFRPPFMQDLKILHRQVSRARIERLQFLPGVKGLAYGAKKKEVRMRFRSLLGVLVAGMV
jgi:hypothetical protein